MTDVSRSIRTADPRFEPWVAEAVSRLDEQHWNAVDPDGRMLDRDAMRGTVGYAVRADLARLTRRLPAGEAAARRPWPTRRIAQTCDQAVAVAAQTVVRFAADRAQIIDTLFGGRDPGRLRAIEPTGGDPHQGGRRVSFLHFEDCAQPLVYKPRPLATATLYANLVHWLNARIPGLAMVSMPALVKDGYGWAGYVRHEPCRTSSEVERFYYREGALLALLYAANGTDAHVDNLVASGDQPILIDTETLLHPVLARRMLVGADPALAALERSVYRTALLPTLIHGERGAMDISGIAGQDGPAGNRATLPNRPVDPADHIPALLRGFGEAYTTISGDADAFSELIAHGEDIVTRIVPRPTQLYADLVEECLAPEMLEDADRIQRLFESALSTDGVEDIGPLMQYECRDLERLDIPIFFARRDSRSIWSSDGERIPGILRVSGIDAARAKVRAMNDADRRCQEWIIAAAFATATGPLDHRCAAPLRMPASAGAQAPPHPQWALDQAFEIARRLDRLAYRDTGRAVDRAAGLGEGGGGAPSGGRVNWLSLEPLGDGHLAILPAGAGLPHGYTGVALFLAQLGAVSGRPEYLERAHEAIAPLPRLLAALAERPAHLAAIGGGFAGLGGIVYALARLAKLLDSPEIATYATDAIERAAAVIEPAAADAVTADAAAESEAESALLTPDDGWCRGLAGRAVSGLSDEALEAWLTHLGSTPPLSDLSLCHGELGIIDALTVLAARRDDARVRAVLDHRSSLLPRAVQQGARFNGVPGDVPTPGLMHGLAGVGYGLLRTAFAASVPSVLLMED